MELRSRSPFVLVLFALGCSGGDPSPFGSDAGGGTCRAQSDCDDHIACTRDACLVGGVCQHEPDNSMCTAPQTCIVGTGCGMPGAMTCHAQSDCDDHIPCTNDTCLVEGTCRHQARNDMCPAGQTCDLARGCSSGPSTTCRMASDCDDTFDCTDDQCDVSGHCVHVPQNARCGAGRTCAAGMGCVMEHACSTDHDCDDGMRCNGTEHCSELACRAGTAVDCDDHDPCTTDTCNETGEMCTHMRSMACMGMVRSGIYDIAMPIRYMCGALGLPGVSINMTAFQFSLSASMLTVTPSPMGAAMTQTPAPTGTNFSVTQTIRGDCDEIYTLTGMFTDATHFTGTFTARFMGFGCGFSDCRDQTFMVRGTAR